MAKGNKPHHGQDQWLIQQAKVIAELKKRLGETTQEVYACFCKVLNDNYGWDAEQITALFARTQELWTELCDSKEMSSMVKWCEDTTNFSVIQGEENKDEQ